MIDVLVAVDDVSIQSNLVRDILGISSIATANNFSMQPMFKISPGFVTETNILHGNDEIESGGGSDYLIGDDIRGSNLIDLTQLKAIDDSMLKLDSIIVDLSVRLSTLGYDTEFFADGSNSSNQMIGFNISVGCDNITTNVTSNAFVTGDILTLVGRTFLATSFGDPLNQIPQVLERIRDVQQVLTVSSS